MSSGRFQVFRTAMDGIEAVFADSRHAFARHTHDGYGIGVIEHMLDEFDTLILLKVKPLLDEVIDLLERRDVLTTSCFIEKVGSPEERVVRDLTTLKGESVNYLSLLIVRNQKRQRGELRRGCRRRKEAEAGVPANA